MACISKSIDVELFSVRGTWVGKVVHQKTISRVRQTFDSMPIGIN
jgi:hypothetical protein